MADLVRTEGDLIREAASVLPELRFSVDPNPDVIYLSRTQVITDRDGPPRVLDKNRDGSRVRYVWQGPASDPVFLLQNCRDSVWEHVDVFCETGCEAVFRMERTSVAGGTIVSTNNLFKDIRIYGNSLAQRGFYARPFIDQNNEHFRFDSVTVYGCTGTAFEFGGQQSKEHYLTQCRIESCGTGIKAGSSIRVVGGTIAACVVAIQLTAVGDPVTLEGVGVEACGRLLVTNNDSATTAAQPVTLVGVRYEADQLHADGDCILLRHAGPLNLLGCRLGGGAQSIPKVGLVGLDVQTLILSGNHFGSYGAHLVNPTHINPGVTGDIVWGTNRYQKNNGDNPNTITKTTWP